MDIDMRPRTRDRERPIQPGHTVIEKPIDKRSNMIDRKAAPRQVLCYVCCAEFGTSSLPIHLKTCLKKHDWGLQSIANDETISKKQAAAKRKKCEVPQDPPIVPIPSAKSNTEMFEEYNQQAQEIFFAHANNCLWCRTQNTEAMEEARRRAEEEEAARRKALEDEEARRRRAEAEEAEARRRAMEDEARRRAMEDEEARRLAEEAARKKLLEDEAHKRAQEEVARWLRDEEEARRRRAEEEAEARRRAEEEAEERRKRLMAQGKHKFLKRGEGVQAATESVNVSRAKELEAKAKHDIAYYSLNHAKKEGLISETAPKRKGSDVTFKEVEIDEAEWKQQWSPEEEAIFSNSVAPGQLT